MPRLCRAGLVLIAWGVCGALPAAQQRAPGEGAEAVLDRAREVYAEAGPKAALPQYERALELFRNDGDRLGEAITLGLIGNCYKRFGDFDRALELLDEALRTKRELGSRTEVAKTLSHLGLVRWELGEYQAAIARFNEAISIARDVGDRKTEGAALNNLSLVYDELGNYERSLEQYGRVLEVYAEIDFPRGESDTLGNIGGVHLLLGRFNRARDYYEQALAISEREGLKPSMSQDLLNLSSCQLALGEVDKALASANRSLELARETGLRLEEAYALRAVASAQLHLGAWDLGLDALRRSLTIYEEIEARGDEVEALGEMGSVYLALGDVAAAESRFHRAATLAREIDDARGLTHALLDLGTLELRRQRTEEATALFLQGRERAEAAGELELVARSGIELAQALRELGRLDEAAREADAAIAVSREIGGRILEAYGHLAAGEIELDRTRLEAAAGSFAAAGKLAADVGDPELLWRIDYGRGLTLVGQGRRREAVEALESAVAHIEGVRGRLRQERFRAGYLGDRYQVYIDLVRLLLELKRTEEALVMAERLRARSYLGLLNRGSPPVATEKEKRREIELRERVRQLERALEEETGSSASWRREPAVELFSRELAAAEREYQSFVDDHLGRTGYAAVRSLQVPALEEVQRRIPPRTAVVEYIVGDDALFVFVLTAERLAATTVALPPGGLSVKIELLRDLLLRGEGDLWRGPSRALGETLLRPVESFVTPDDVDRLVVVPHGVLYYLPFAALLRDFAGSDRLLIDDYVLSYSPAVSALVSTREPPRASTELLAVAPASSRLKWAPREVEGIAAMYPRGSRRVLLGDRATERAFKRWAGGYRMIHVASHADFNMLNPLLSSLQLEADGPDDGRLEVHEILGLELEAQLTTLSACNTALGSGYFTEFPAGDDFVGLTRAFLLAGSESVLATLWQVDDRSTLELMRAFYRRLENAKTPDRASALAIAQRELARDERYRHPYHWAPFVLTGAIQ